MNYHNLFIFLTVRFMWYEMTELKEILDNMDLEEVQGLIEHMGKGSDGYALYCKIDTYASKRKECEKKPKGIDILMTCGEKLHLDTDQPEIEYVKLNGKQIYPQNQSRCNIPKNKHDVIGMLTTMLGGEWRFSTNTTQTMSKYLSESWCTKGHPEKTHDIIFYPVAWDIYNKVLKHPNYKGVYIRPKL